MSELEDLSKKVHDLDKRLYLSEANLKRLEDLSISVVAKLDNLADRIVVSLSKVIDERIKLHHASCENNKNGKTQFSEWIIRALIAIIMTLLGFVGKAWLGGGG